MWLVLCHTSDLSALWVFRRLQALALAPVELVTVEELSYSLTWEHRLGKSGATISIALADGRVLDGAAITGVLNRLNTVPLDHWRGSPEPERDYAMQEFYALYLSWLAALPCRVLNRPAPEGIGGRWRAAAEWALLAQRAGLPVLPYTRSSCDGVDENSQWIRLVPAASPPTGCAIVLNDTVTGAPVPKELRDACVRLARAAETELLGIDFAQTEAGPWTFSTATPYPDLSFGGPALVLALAHAFLPKEAVR